MHTSTLFLVALASIAVTFTSAKPLDKGNSVTGIHQGFENMGSLGNFHQKRKMRKRFSPGNSGTTHGAVSPNTYVASSPSASRGTSSGGGLGGGLTDGITKGLPIVGTSSLGSGGGGLPLVGDLV